MTRIRVAVYDANRVKIATVDGEILPGMARFEFPEPMEIPAGGTVLMGIEQPSGRYRIVNNPYRATEGLGVAFAPPYLDRKIGDPVFAQDATITSIDISETDMRIAELLGASAEKKRPHHYMGRHRANDAAEEMSAVQSRVSTVNTLVREATEAAWRAALEEAIVILQARASGHAAARESEAMIALRDAESALNRLRLRGMVSDE